MNPREEARRKLNEGIEAADEALAHQDKDDFMVHAERALPKMRAATDALQEVADAFIAEVHAERAQELEKERRRSERRWWEFWK